MAAVAISLIATACSGGDEASDDTSAEPSVDTTATDETVTDADSTEPTPPGTAAPVDVATLMSAEPTVVDDTAETRCDRLGYPCSWSDVDQSEMDRSHELSIELEAIIADAGDPAAGLEAAVDRLADVDDLVELIVDQEGLTGLMFRLDGLPEMYAFSEFAGPVGPSEPLDLAALGVESLAAEPAQPQGFRAVPRDYHPTGGPIVPKTAVVIDPYAKRDVECPEEIPDGIDCRITSDNRVEGSVIHAILNAQEQITSTYVPAADDPSQPGGWDPILGPPLSGFDLVHLASHGSSGCADIGPGWVATWGGSDEPVALPDRCYSVSAIGIYNRARYAGLSPEERRIPDGLSLSGDKWVARDDWFTGQLKSTAIVYMSHCTSADGSLLASGRYGSFVGWHSYARLTTAQEAGIMFWNLMATEGLEFDQAIEQLAENGLDSTVVADIANGGAAGAFLAHRGKNQRARDVVTLELDGADPDGQVLRVEGMPADGQPERFPAEQQSLTIEVEGVRDGTAGEVTIDLYYDGQKLMPQQPIDLEADGTEVASGADWGTWRVQVRPGLFEIPDTTPADFAIGAAAKPLEVRAYVTEAEYTADRGNVTLGALLASNGPLPIFTELANGMPANGEVRGNDLRIEFDTAGGDVEGQMLVEMVASGIPVGEWRFDLTGTYDPATGTISGDLSGSAFGGFAGIYAGDSGSGTWEGTVDLAGANLQATLGVNGQSQPYTGRITPVTSSG